jgi:predicted acetyltransferase
VATADRFRRRGIATAVLEGSLVLMERDRVDFSLLMTGIPRLYTKLGWEPVMLPWLRIRCNRGIGGLEESTADGKRARNGTRGICVEELSALPVRAPVLSLYENAPHRPLHFSRPRRYFETYAAWSWANERLDPRILLLSRQETWEGYAVLSLGGEDQVRVDELRALDARAETELVRAAIAWASLRDRSEVELHFMPQFLREDDLAGPYSLDRTARTDFMIRRIAMPECEYDALKASLECGESVLWDGDDF